MFPGREFDDLDEYRAAKKQRATRRRAGYCSGRQERASEQHGSLCWDKNKNSHAPSTPPRQEDGKQTCLLHEPHHQELSRPPAPPRRRPRPRPRPPPPAGASNKPPSALSTAFRNGIW